MVKNPLWFLLIFLGFAGCNDKPTFPVTPVIELSEFYFKDIENLSLDSLVIKIRFEDGDGDLGLESFETNPPYQLLDPVTTGPPNYDTLRHGDPNTPPYDCVNYEIIRKEFSRNDSLFVTADTILVERNPNHFNFFLEFLIKTDDGSFRVFNPALERNCAPPYHGRYFVLNTARDIRPLEGELQYSLVSGFLLLFRNDIIKLRIQIQDRSLNKSNVIETDEFRIFDIIREP
jgi:hypothetical protein